MKLVTIFTALLTLTQSATAKEETLFYCADEMVTGFIKINDQWQISNFEGRHFSIKVKGDWESLVFENQPFDCHTFDSQPGISVSCKVKYKRLTWSFKIEPKSGKYVNAQTSNMGFVAQDRETNDTDFISAGQCEEF